MSQSDSREIAESSVEQYCSISEAVKLVSVQFDGDRRKLKEFIDNLNTAFELVKPEQHSLLKFVKTKITGDARSKLLVRDLSSAWREVKQILEENYGVKRTLDYYACPMFSSRQDNNESIASWSSRIDTMQSELREAAFRIFERR
jgi:dynactin complex subunit